MIYTNFFLPTEVDCKLDLRNESNISRYKAIECTYENIVCI